MNLLDTKTIAYATGEGYPPPGPADNRSAQSIVPRHQDLENEIADDSAARFWLTAMVENNLVGRASWRYPTTGDRWCAVKIVTEPEWRGKGIGAQIWHTLLAELAGIAPRCLVAQVDQDDGHSEAWATKKGFRRVGERVELSLCLNRRQLEYLYDERESIASAVRERVGTSSSLVSLSYEPDITSAYYNLHKLCVSSAGERYQQPPFSQRYFETLFLNPLTHPPGLTVLCIRKGELLGFSALMSRGEGRFYTSYTGVTPALRGRGVATWLKCESIIRAIAFHDGREIATSNSSENAGMIAVNRNFGFRTVRKRHLLEVCRPWPIVKHSNYRETQ